MDRICPRCLEDTATLIATRQFPAPICERCLRRLDPAGMRRLDAFRRALAQATSGSRPDRR